MNSASLVDTQPLSHLKLFSNQSKLPPLPVCDLRQTLDQYLRSLEPLCNGSELSENRRLCDEFFTSEQAKRYQAALIERAHKERNWLERLFCVLSV